jgi:hypothetical protein
MRRLVRSLYARYSGFDPYFLSPLFSRRGIPLTKRRKTVIVSGPMTVNHPHHSSEGTTTRKSPHQRSISPK